MPQNLSTSPRSVESSIWQGLSFPSPLNGVIVFVITSLGGYLQVQYQPKNTSPFEENKMIMWAIFVALSLYASMLIAEFQMQVLRSSFLSIIKRFTLLMGALVAVLITIIILPLFGYFKLLLWIIFFAKAIVASYEEICQWFWEALLHIREVINSYFKQARAHFIEMKNSYYGREEINLPV